MWLLFLYFDEELVAYNWRTIPVISVAHSASQIILQEAVLKHVICAKKRGIEAEEEEEEKEEKEEEER